MNEKNIISVWTKYLFFVPLLPALSTVFVINNSFANGVVSGKYFWFYGSMGLVAIATVIHSIINKRSFRFSATDGFVALFTGSVFLSSCVINDASANTTKLTSLVLLLVLYFCLRITFQGIANRTRNDRIIYVCYFIILTGLVEAVWGLLQLYGIKSSQHNLFRLTGSFFNPGPYAGYLAVVFPLALHFFVSGTQMTRISQINADNRLKSALISVICVIRVQKLIAAVTCIVIILVLPAAMSRASWLAAIAGSVVVVIPRLTRNPLTNMRGLRVRPAMTERFRGLRVKPAMTRVKVKPAMTVAVIILLACSALFGMYYLKKDSADGRLLTWKVSLSVIAKHPLGVGLGHFPSAYGDAQAAYFASGKASETEEYVAGNPEYGFNEFLQIAIESGIVSLLLFIALLVSAFLGLIKNKHWGVIGALVALLVFACFSYPFSVLPFPILFVFLLAMSHNSRHCEEERRSNPEKSYFKFNIKIMCMLHFSIPSGMIRSVAERFIKSVLHPVGDASLTVCSFFLGTICSTERYILKGMCCILVNAYTFIRPFHHYETVSTPPSVGSMKNMMFPDDLIKYQ